MELIFRILIASSIPLLFLYFILQLDFYQTSQFRLILLCLGWGVLAYYLVSTINNTLKSFNIVGLENIVHIYAPLLEELFKGMILIYLVRRSRFTYSIDGALYGFATGIGFAVFENFEAINSQTTEAILQRVFSANLVHASSSAIIGIALGVFWLRRVGPRWLFLIAGLFLAIGQHMLYNKISHGGNSLFAAFVTGILGAGFIALVMQQGKKQTQNWIKEKLGMEDRVTQNEVAVVDRLANSDAVLYPVVERFGPETASQVEKLLYLQARLGIKRKSLDSIQNNDAIHNAVEVEINEMRADMENIQREIGAYAMLFVRGLFTEEMISVWDQMQAKIQERSAATGGQKGSGLWSSLDERVKSASENERVE